jgi:hypothetical protein
VRCRSRRISNRVLDLGASKKVSMKKKREEKKRKKEGK